MVPVFDIEDQSGRKIHLSKERWRHINEEHPEIAAYLEALKDTLVNPLRIITYTLDDTVHYYHRYYKERASPAKYLIVIVKYLNHHGFIITAYFVRTLP